MGSLFSTLDKSYNHDTLDPKVITIENMINSDFSKRRIDEVTKEQLMIVRLLASLIHSIPSTRYGLSSSGSQRTSNQSI